MTRKRASREASGSGAERPGAEGAESDDDGHRRPVGSRTSAELREEQARTLATPRRRYGPPARLLFALLDLFYGRKRTLSKFKVLEVIARVPYQAWENVAYVAVTHRYSKPEFARRI